MKNINLRALALGGGGCKNPLVAILPTKPIKRCYNRVAIWKKIYNPTTVGWYIPNLTIVGCKIILLYFILLQAHSLFPIFFSLSQPPFLSPLISSSLSTLFCSLLSLPRPSGGGIDMEQWLSRSRGRGIGVE